MASFLVLYVLMASATLVAISRAQEPVPCPDSVFSVRAYSYMHLSNLPTLFTQSLIPTDYPIFFSSLSCNSLSPTSCDVFVAMRPNPSDTNFLDVFMTANASGWVAVGFSDTRSMVCDNINVELHVAVESRLKVVNCLHSWLTDFLCF